MKTRTTKKTRKTLVHVSDIKFNSSEKEFNDISVFENNIKLKVYIKEVLLRLNKNVNKDIIYLVSVEFEGEANDPRSPIFVSEFEDDITHFIRTYTDYNYDENNNPENSECMYVSDIFIFSYDNYEEAYEDALYMRERADTCYKKTNEKTNKSEYGLMDKVLGYIDGDSKSTVVCIIDSITLSCDISEEEPIGEFSYSITEEFDLEEIESTDDIERWCDVDVICKVQSFPYILFVNINNQKFYVRWYNELYDLLCEKVYEDDDRIKLIAVKYKNGAFEQAGSIEEVIYSITNEIDYITIRLFDDESKLNKFIKEN